jgi:hypothetical protein
MTNKQPPEVRRALTPTSYNGLLAYLPSTFVSKASSTLPPPSEKEDHTPQRKVEIDAAEFGKIIITFRLSKYRHYRNSYWRWSAEWVDAVADDS